MDEHLRQRIHAPLTIRTSHLTAIFDIAGTLVEAGGNDTVTPPAYILAWAEEKKAGTVAAKENWVLIKTKKGNTLYHFHRKITLA
jgi:hypothetical protein